MRERAIAYTIDNHEQFAGRLQLNTVGSPSDVEVIVAPILPDAVQFTDQLTDDGDVAKVKCCKCYARFRTAPGAAAASGVGPGGGPRPPQLYVPLGMISRGNFTTGCSQL